MSQGLGHLCVSLFLFAPFHKERCVPERGLAERYRKPRVSIRFPSGAFSLSLSLSLSGPRVHRVVLILTRLQYMRHALFKRPVTTSVYGSRCPATPCRPTVPVVAVFRTSSTPSAGDRSFRRNVLRAFLSYLADLFGELRDRGIWRLKLGAHWRVKTVASRFLANGYCFESYCS